MNPTPIELFLLLRKRKRWTQKTAAKKLGISLRRLRGWEDGTRKPEPIVERYVMDFINGAKA